MGDGLKRAVAAARKTQPPRLTRKQWEALGSLGLPRDMGGRDQLHPATAAKLVALGYIEERDTLLRGRFPVRVKLHYQTPAGNLAFCQWAARQKPPQEHGIGA